MSTATVARERPTSAPGASAGKPPLWLVIATAAMAVALLAMSVGETSLKGQYLIDQGEYLSLFGLAFILLAGVHLHRRNRLLASLPLVFPWLLYPVITQGDQIIDNLSITWMRLVVHVLLAAIFAMPVAVIVFAARWLFTLSPRASKQLAIALLAAEFALAYLYLGWLMIATLIVMIALVVLWPAGQPVSTMARQRRASAALWILVAGVAASGALYLGFKNRPGAYQGSPSFYMDPSKPGGAYDLTAVAVSSNPIAVPAGAADVRSALTAFAASLQTLLDGYYVLDRNYNYHFHNELFLRSDPLLANYRLAGLLKIVEAGGQRRQADALAEPARLRLGAGDPLAALLDDVRLYTAFSFTRAVTLEKMSTGFETTKAGLQHATHLYEGEGKYLGVQLDALLKKHHRVLTAPSLQPIVSDFVVASRAIYGKYSNRIVGF